MKMFALLMLAGCSLYSKSEGSNELESIAQDVLKKGTGIDIEIKPIPSSKK
jgi:hypothetical protein